MAASWQQLFGFLDQLGGKLDELTEIQKEKTGAVRRDDLMGVNECMKKEQVISLSLRSMDQKREKLLKELGLENLPVSALPKHCPPELREEAQSAVERLQGRFLIYKSAAQVSRNTLEVNLHQIEKIIAEEERGGPVGGNGGGTMADIRA